MVSTLRLLLNGAPDGVADSWMSGADDATSLPFGSKTWITSNDGCEATEAAKRAGRSGLETMPTCSCARVRSSDWRSSTQSLIRTAALSAVASARALV